MTPDDVPYPGTVDALVDVLRRDHVLVQETRGSGDTAGALARIGRLVAEIPFQTYVAVIDPPAEVDAGNNASSFLATALSRRIQEPGLYVVSAGGSPLAFRMVGTGWDETIFSLQSSTDARAVEQASGDPVLTPTVAVESMLETALASPPKASGSDYGQVSVSDEVVDDLADRERALQPFDRPDLGDDPAGPWDTGTRWMVGTVVGAGTLAALLQSLVGWPGWRTRRERPDQSASRSTARDASPPAPPDIEAVRKDADAELTALAEELRAASHGEHRDRAASAREAAEPLLSSTELLDVVGALTLARAGRRELAIAAGEARSAYRVCFFDPRHPAATEQAEWRFGDSDLELPVCRRCGRDVARGREPETLTVRRRGRQRPYYEGDSVWARTGFGSLTTDLGELAALVGAERRQR